MFSSLMSTRRVGQANPSADSSPMVHGEGDSARTELNLPAVKFHVFH